ncbi:MAG: LytTR family DNA-binding domain-containing protein [Flavobacterium sp.]|uniref:LytR/AlgR family response regulator transcription factor n=1 Tax=Flavobacterium sp. TaxID=239 RepID=UPI0022BE727B|nr:LytTR family DNA-binding domain-containing protein [Flavobacterium sp.]MCZ8330688.1 LytTR family DNA-binding domain-containing protein [Flavobacterium sp.]
MIKIIIIEDEILIAERLKKMIESIEPEMKVIEVIDSVKEAISYLSDSIPDLIFLDINLSDDYCFKIFEEVNVTCPVIFVTAYSEYAIKAFEVNSIDYLLKPISIPNLKKSIDKYKSLTTFPNYTKMMIDMESRYRNRFLVKLNNQLKSISIDNIAYFFSEDKLTFACLNDGKKLPLDFSLKKIEEEINPNNFFRINKKYLISLNSIDEMYYVSKSKIKLQLKPTVEKEIIFVAIEKIGTFKVWLSR